ncbi:MAG: metal-dependent hydrolase [Hyphococcus sp.]|nr:MAG: metal-dependent hydrolase [Marinicaulis sp.]
MSISAAVKLFQKHPEKLKALRGRYAEPGRYYHNWQHIEQLLASFEEVSERVHRPEGVLFAIYYHDAIYDVASKTNEEDSAELFKNEWNSSIDSDDLEFSHSLILATKKHRIDEALTAQDKVDCAYFLDLDMSVLGMGESEYFNYAKNIRKEYSVFSDEMYNLGRAKLLTDFLAQERIYLTDYFHRLYEINARENIQKEILMLSC